MLSATELRLATQHAGDLPDWLRQRSPTRIWPLEQAKTVTLRMADCNLLVKVRERSSILVGEVCGFEPNHGAHVGIRVGDLIVFNESHIFAATD